MGLAGVMATAYCLGVGVAPTTAVAMLVAKGGGGIAAVMAYPRHA